MMKRLLFILIGLMVLGSVANAQRLLPSQGGLELWGGVPIQKQGLFIEGSLNAGLNCTRYLKHYHYYHFGASYGQQHYLYGDIKVPVRDFMADGGFMFHLLSTPGKNFLVYGGAYATLGYEEVNEGERILPDGAYLNAQNSFVYGGGLQVSFEVFVTDKLVLFARVKGHFLGGTDLDLFRPALNFGIRVIM